MENCSIMDPWFYRLEPWISDAFTFENAALAKALQISISESSSSSGPPSASPAISVNAVGPIASPETLSAATSSPPITTTSSSSFLLQQLASSAGGIAASASRRRSPIGYAPPAAGRVSKRKSRASKRSPTTYINADPANFREMVQRVTGVRPGGDAEPGSFLPHPAGPVCKPEKRLAATAVGDRIGASLLQHICLPTLDTSAFLLDRSAVVPAGDGSMGRAAEPGFELDQMMPAFPTLESWGVM